MIHKKRVILKGLVLTGSVVLTSGCIIQPPYPDDPSYAPVMPEYQDKSKVRHGSLYHPVKAVSLFDDIKAHQVGDIITVMLSESHQASMEMDTEYSRDSAASITNPTILGSTPEINAPGILPLQSNRDNTLGVTIDGDTAFSGESDSSQKNSLSGTIAVTVMQVLPNGNLVIKGEKWLNLNQGREFVRVSGIVRPEDISSENSIISTKIANARIGYGGTGTIANATNPGWLMKSIVSIFWPF